MLWLTMDTCCFWFCYICAMGIGKCLGRLGCWIVLFHTDIRGVARTTLQCLCLKKFITRQDELSILTIELSTTSSRFIDQQWVTVWVKYPIVDLHEDHTEQKENNYGPYKNKTEVQICVHRKHPQKGEENILSKRDWVECGVFVTGGLVFDVDEHKQVNGSDQHVE